MSWLLKTIHILLLSAQVTIQSTRTDLSIAYEKWKCDFDIKFTSVAMEKESFKNFAVNFQFVQNHNKKFQNGSVQYRLGLWEQSDQPSQTIHSKFNKAQMPVDTKSKIRP